MNAYKVKFKDGRAVSAKAVDPARYADIQKFRSKDGRQQIEWYIVQCDTKEQAIEIADKVVMQIWKKVME